MSILAVGSTNPNLSHILAKNPATIRDSGKAFSRDLRKGKVYGWYNSSGQEFKLWFKDTDVESSFSQGGSDEFEYLDKGRYASPYVPIAMITAALASAVKGDSEFDVPSSGYVSYVRTNIKVANLRYLEQLAHHYLPLGVNISYELIHGKYYRVVIEAGQVSLALNVLQVVCTLQCLCDDETYVRMDQDSVVKFVKVFNRANAPYYPRYLFQMKSNTDPNTFSKIRNDLQGEGMILHHGDTRTQRFSAIKQELKGGSKLIDIGCGEMFQAMRLSKVYETVYAIDADEDRAMNNIARVKGRGLDNIVATHEMANVAWVLEHEDLLKDADVLMTEVLEHIEFEEADELLTQMLVTADPAKVVVTAPNKDFNKFYALADDTIRHDDHKWEPTFEEFCDWVVTVAAAADYDVNIKGIGDSVDDISTSIMAVFTRKAEKDA